MSRKKLLQSGLAIMFVTGGLLLRLVSYMDNDLGYFDDETCRLEPIDNPFQPKVLPISPE